MQLGPPRKAASTGHREVHEPSDSPPEIYDMLAGVSARTERIEDLISHLLDIVTRQVSAKDWYSTAEFAAEVGKAEFTIRSACNKRRLIAEKTENGREWRIARSELDRYRRQGLLPVAVDNDEGR